MSTRFGTCVDEIADELGAEETAGAWLPGQSHRDLVCAGVVDLVVVAT